MRAPSLKPNFSIYINIVYITYFSLEGQTFKYTSRAQIPPSPSPFNAGHADYTLWGGTYLYDKD